MSGWERQARNRKVLKNWKGICHVCGQGGARVVDHVVPVAQGGADDVSNLRPIHQEPCHRVKTEAEAAVGRTSSRLA